MAQENNEFGDPGELLKRGRKQSLSLKEWIFVLQLSIFIVRMKIRIPHKVFFKEQFGDSVGRVLEIVTIPLQTLPLVF